MNTKPNIVLTGYIDVPADRLDAVRAALPDHVALTRVEPGCLSFEVHEDPQVPGRFTVAERFVDRDAFDAHQTRTGASPWADITAGLARHYAISEL